MSEVIIVAVITSVSAVLQVVILRRQGKSEKEQEDAKKRTEILLEASEASLIGLKQLGANGRVTESLKALEAYKNSKAAV